MESVKNKFKSLYQFDVYVNQEVEEKVVKKNEAGEEVTEAKKVKKSVPRKVALRKPTRALLDDAELYFNVLVSQGINAGLMSRALLAKRFNNDGGVLSDPEKEAYAKAYYDLEQKQREYARLSLKEEKNRTDVEKEREAELVKAIGTLRRDLQDLEVAQLSLYDITAESRARTKTILWWVLNLTYMQPTEEDVWVPVFDGKTFEEKMNSYDIIEEGDELTDEQRDFFFKAIRKAAAAVAFWFYGKASKQEDFVALENEINQEVPVSKKDEEQRNAEDAAKQKQEATAAPDSPKDAGEKTLGPLAEDLATATAE